MVHVHCFNSKRISPEAVRNPRVELVAGLNERSTEAVLQHARLDLLERRVPGLDLLARQLAERRTLRVVLHLDDGVLHLLDVADELHELLQAIVERRVWNLRVVCRRVRFVCCCFL